MTLFSGFLSAALPATHLVAAREGSEVIFQLIAALVSLGAVYLAYLFFLRSPRLSAAWPAHRPARRSGVSGSPVGASTGCTTT